MLTKEENDFLQCWSQERVNGKKDIKTYLKGLSGGLLIGLGIIIAVITGWYKRANMDAGTQLNPLIFLIAILLIGVFMGFLYQNYQWEMKEQQYLELLDKKKKQETDTLTGLQ
jgi:hypothetical protein